MNHIKVWLTGFEIGMVDVAIAQLANIGYDGFEEQETCLLAYIGEPEFEATALADIATSLNLTYTTEIVPSQNWNAVWESNFEPVIVDDFCTVRAAFHDLTVITRFEIVITPKMSFGTGHHATTQSVMRMMRDVDFSGRKVLDFGTGTGVLAILAEKLGADRILGIDNDDWAVENAIENVQANGCSRIEVQKASVAEIEPDAYDVILANINRHILLDNMAELARRLVPGGVLILSGLLTTDRDIIEQSVESALLMVDNQLEMNGWIALHIKHK